MNLSQKSKPALILIDIQVGFDQTYWGNRNNPDAETNASILLNKWRELGYPVFHIQHLSVNPASPLSPQSAGSAIKDIVKPLASEPLITKNVNSAFIGTNLEQLLQVAQVEQVVLVGISSDHCVNTSTRMAANLGFEAIIVSDATVAFERTGPDGRHWSADEIHSASLASLHEEFAIVLKTNQVLSQIQPAPALVD